MSDESDFLENSRKASIKTHVEQLRLIQRVKERTARRARGGATDESCEPGGDAFPIGDFVFDLARLHVSAYNSLLDVSSKYTDKLIDSLCDLSAQKPHPHPYPHPTVRPVLSFSGSLNQLAVAEFTVENGGRRTVEVRFSVSEFRDVDGGPPFSANVLFTSGAGAPPPPDDRRIEPGEARRFCIRVALCAPFEGGHIYDATVFIAAGGRIREDLPIRVEVTR